MSTLAASDCPPPVDLIMYSKYNLKTCRTAHMPNQIQIHYNENVKRKY